jgi:pimeloyl-ACP methyl ester carboxylesterase
MSTDELGWSNGLRMRTYGESGPIAIALHGGAAASGCAGPIARGLADSFRVLEPWQRLSGPEPLTVATHVADLHKLVTIQTGQPPALAGHSWGAMLALAYAAKHPDTISAVVLVGCGTFDTNARARMKEIISGRLTDDDRHTIAEIERTTPDHGESLMKRYEIIGRTYDFDTLEDTDEMAEPFDGKAHKETGDDVIRLQASGAHPAAFSAITTPVLMLHGDYDPHPGRMIRDGLKENIPHIEYHELARCGHEPWNERHARDEFFHVMKVWLAGVMES